MRVWPQCSVWSLNAAHLIIILHFSHLRTQKVPGSSTNASSCWTVAVLRWPGPLLPTCQSFQEWPALPPRTPARRLKMENYWTTTPLLRTVALLVCSHLYTHHRMDVALKVHPSIFCIMMSNPCKQYSNEAYKSSSISTLHLLFTYFSFQRWWRTVWNGHLGEAQQSAVKTGVPSPPLSPPTPCRQRILSLTASFFGSVITLSLSASRFRPGLCVTKSVPSGSGCEFKTNTEKCLTPTMPHRSVIKQVSENENRIVRISNHSRTVFTRCAFISVHFAQPLFRYGLPVLLS